MEGTPGPERTKRAPGSHAVGGLLSRPLHVLELHLRTLGLALQIHALRLCRPIYGVAVLLVLVLVGLAAELRPGALGRPHPPNFVHSEATERKAIDRRRPPLIHLLNQGQLLHLLLTTCI